jgi:hypothetical protein
MHTYELTLEEVSFNCYLNKTFFAIIRKTVVDFSIVFSCVLKTGIQGCIYDFRNVYLRRA